MSYQLSATPDMDIPANEKSTIRSNRYAVASVVLLYMTDSDFRFVRYDVSIETAINEGRAIDKVFQPLAKKYRECNGYICRVKAEQIAD